MSKKIVYLIRHAQSLGNIGVPSENTETMGLSDLGKDQAKQLVPKLESLGVKAVRVSPYLRTSLTAAPFLRAHPQIIPQTLDIQEYSYIDTKTHDESSQRERREMRRNFWASRSPTFKENPNCESFSEVLMRARAFLREIPHQPDRCAIFGHGVFLTICLIALRNPDLSNESLMVLTEKTIVKDQHNFRNAEVVPLEIKHGEIRTPKLPDPIQTKEDKRREFLG